MSLNITKLANLEGDKSKDFLDKIDSKLKINFKKSLNTGDDEWIDMVEFTIPYIEKAFEKQIKQIISEEEVVKIESIRKVSVESIKHLTKHVNYVEEYDPNNGDVIPNKILNIYKDETFITYENRFLYTLIRLIEDFMFLRGKEEVDLRAKGKNYQKATYQAETNVKQEKVKVKFDYSIEKPTPVIKNEERIKRIKEIQKSLKTIKTTLVYQVLEDKQVTLVKPPLKMTNVLLKNVNFQYAVKLWNYLREQLDIKQKAEKESNEHEEKGLTKELIDEDIYLMHLIFKNHENQEKIKRQKKNSAEQKKMIQELTDALIAKIIDLNPDLSDQQLKQLIADKYMIMKAKRMISLKPVEDKFKERIDKYMSIVREVRLK